MSKLCHFNSVETLDISNFTQEEDGQVRMRGLVLVEGSHVDSKKRKHNFSRERVFRIATNSNRHFKDGARIPFLKDHKKEQDSVIGALSEPFEARIITPEDVAPNNQGLVGKLGIFATKVNIQAASAIQQAKEGLINTISPGLDIVTDVIKEISATPTPAIVGMSLSMFNSPYNSKALTWEDAERECQDLEETREEFNSLSEKFFSIMCNIRESSEQELEEVNIDELVGQAMSTYMEKLAELFNLDEDAGNEMGQQGSPYQNQAAYSMYDNALSQGINLAEFGEFGFLTKVKKFGNKFIARPARSFFTKRDVVKSVGQVAVGKNSLGVPIMAKRTIFTKQPRTKRWGRIAGVGALGAGGVAGGMYLNGRRNRNQ